MLLLAGCAGDGISGSGVTRDVPAGQETRVRFYAGWDVACAPTGMQLDVIRPPSNGMAEVRPTVGRVGSVGTAAGSQCVGREIEGRGIFYRPRDGFRGTDQLTYTAYVGGSPRTNTVTLNVR